ncbi:hypothetical protein [Mucilaginibacter gracilis]|nr:hypothetical protein [Mucilaginibacter gracilis]
MQPLPSSETDISFSGNHSGVNYWDVSFLVVSTFSLITVKSILPAMLFGEEHLHPHLLLPLLFYQQLVKYEPESIMELLM